MVKRTRRSEATTFKAIEELINALPTVPKEFQPREIVVDVASDEEIKELEQKGYKLTILMFLPKATDEEAVRWIQKFSQGVTDGTVSMPTEREKAIVNEMRMRGLYSGKANNFDAVRKEVDKDVDSILNWKKSRHQVGASTTMVSQKDMHEFIKYVRAVLKKKRDKNGVRSVKS